MKIIPLRPKIDKNELLKQLKKLREEYDYLLTNYHLIREELRSLYTQMSAVEYDIHNTKKELEKVDD